MLKITGSEDYYPTPESLLDQITRGMKWFSVKTVLEPSAGKGDIAEYVLKKMRKNPNREIYEGVDCIEIEPELRSILKGKDLRVVHDDFLTFQTYKHYDLIFMNPPFSSGAKHLLKAIEVQQLSGGAIICILNAETLRNPYSNERRDLLQRLESYNADVKYYEKAFLDAERPTDVEVAVVRVIVPEPARKSTIFETLRTKEYQPYQDKAANEVIESDLIKMSVALYNLEVEYGLRLYEEYSNMQKYSLNSKSIVLLGYNGSEYGTHYEEFDPNGYIYNVRRKYWNKLLQNPKITGKLTSNLYDEYTSRLNEFANYDFSYWNIKTLQAEIAQRLVEGIETSIIKLFDELSHKHYWDETGTSGNVHYYNGWKTNSSYKINPRVILPLQIWGDRISLTYNLNQAYSISKLEDIEKVLNYLDNGETGAIDLRNQIEINLRTGITKNIDCKYFTVTFYKKGTCHITFTNERLLKKFNIFGSQKKGWLPKGYAKRSYQEMTPEEQSVIESFEGQASYMESYADAQYYLFDVTKSMPMLEGGESNV